jgi:hypothetical protein
MPRGKVFPGHAEIAERLEGSELIKRMQADPLIILRHRSVLGNLYERRMAGPASSTYASV